MMMKLKGERNGGGSSVLERQRRERERGGTENESDAKRKLSSSINICWLCAHAACLLPLLVTMMVFKIMQRKRFLLSLSPSLSLSLSANNSL